MSEIFVMWETQRHKPTIWGFFSGMEKIPCHRRPQCGRLALLVSPLRSQIVKLLVVPKKAQETQRHQKGRNHVYICGYRMHIYTVYIYILLHTHTHMYIYIYVSIYVHI